MGRPPSATRTRLQTLLAVAVRGAGALASLLVTLVVARTLGAADAGLFFLCYTLLQFIATPARLGLDGSALRFIGQAHARGNGAAARALQQQMSRWTLLASLAITLPLLLSADALASHVFNKPALAAPLRITLLAVPLLALLPVIASALKGIDRGMAALVVQSILPPALTAALLLPLLLLLAAPASAAFAALALLAGHALAVALALAFWRRSPRAGDPAARPATHEIVASAKPMFIVSLLSILVLWSAQLVAGAWLPPEELAWLNVAQRLAGVLALPHLALAATLVARSAACLERNDRAALAALVGRATRMALALALLPALTMLLLPGPLLAALFGNEFAAGGTLLAILVAAQLVNVLTGPAFMLLNISGHERDIRNVSLVSGGIAVLAAVLLTHFLGVTGAALAAALAISVQNLALAACVRRRLGFWAWRG